MHGTNATPSSRKFGFFLRWFGLSLLAIGTSLFAKSKEEWLPISPEELTASASTIEPNAPAEILFRKIEMNDREMPAEYVLNEYVRYKVYLPEKAEAITRISRQEQKINDGFNKIDVELSARLVLPNGTIKTFGNEAIRERNLQESAAERTILRSLFGTEKEERKEKFLAISGIEAGSIIEYRITTTYRYYNLSFRPYLLQVSDLPTRKVEYICKSIRNSDYAYSCFLLNKSLGKASLTENRDEHEVHVTASNVPSLSREPLSGGRGDYSLAVLDCYKYNSKTVLSRSGVWQHYSFDPSKVGLWAPTATDAYVIQADCAIPTDRVKKIALELTSKAGTSIAKAQLIHQYCQERLMEFRKLPKRKIDRESYYYNRVQSLDDILDYAKNPKTVGADRNDFLWLAMAMYRSIGLECREVLLPDRQFQTFNRVIVSPVLLSEAVAQVKIDGNWIFSCPNSVPPLLLGCLPWYSEGQEALVAQPEKEEFIRTPVASAKQSMIGNGGTFELSTDGTLTGSGKRKYVGHSADVVRSTLSRKNDPRIPRKFFRITLNDIFKNLGESENNEESMEKDNGEEENTPNEQKFIKIGKISGVDTAGDLELDYKVSLPGYAIASDDRLILRPSLFRHNFASPFVASTRTNHVRFPYAWQELDAINIKLPPGYKPEIAEQPAMSPCPGFFYRNTLSYDAGKHLVRLRREFSCQQTVVPVDAYPTLKNWFDEMIRGDQYELVLVKSATPAELPPNSSTAPESKP